jgi:hypothetical protein
MCRMVYIASDTPLTTIDWIKGESSICVEEFPRAEMCGKEHCIPARFSKPHMYFVGDHHGTGEGFSYGQWWVGDDECLQKQDRADRESVRRLSEYLTSAVELAGEIEMLVVFAGQEDAPITTRSTMTPADFGGDIFELKDTSFITIVPSGG